MNVTCRNTSAVLVCLRPGPALRQRAAGTWAQSSCDVGGAQFLQSFGGTGKRLGINQLGRGWRVEIQLLGARLSFGPH